MALDGNELPRRVHALHGAKRGRTEGNNIRRIVEDDILVHLLNALQKNQYVMAPCRAKGMEATYEFILSKQLLSLFRQIHLGH